MSSDDSDNETLASLAAAKAKEEGESEEYIDRESDEDFDPISPKPKKRKVLKKTRINRNIVTNVGSLSISLVSSSAKRQSGRQIFNEKAVVRLPQDVWLYLKDLARSGPYSCLLCQELFVSRLRIIGHYILDHGKFYCGICRYIVADKQAWEAHLLFHSPWTCSQCNTDFKTETELQQHLKETHSQVHCRVCYLRMPLGEAYNSHLLQKHNVEHAASIDEESHWEMNKPKAVKFRCLLCSKSNLCSNFLNHYVGYHHFTLRCFGTIVCGKEIPFRVSGANITDEFKRDLNIEGKCGYVGLNCPYSAESKPIGLITEDCIVSDMIVKVKQEVSDLADRKENKQDVDIDTVEEVKSYKGKEDFDITLTEVIILQKSSYDYLEQCFASIEAKIVPEISNIAYESVKVVLTKTIEYESEKVVLTKPIKCPICSKKFETYKEFMNHIDKLHLMKVAKSYACRVCFMAFDSQMELDAHISAELGDFKDLWICQFCDKEFDDRITTRTHLSEHWDELEPDNCFSPHLGFKCRNCPMLFWNEPEREEHQIKAHVNKKKEQHYTCECSESFSDKTWFIHHYFSKHFQNEVTLLKCCLCTKVLSTVDRMRIHFFSEHPEAKRVFCCLGNCQYWPLGAGETLQTHLKSHVRGKGKKSYECPVCRLEFPTRRSRIAHAAQSHGTGRFRCKMCGELLLSADERKLHYLMRHQGQQPYKCADCGKAFQYKSSLCIHKRNHLPEQKNYTCHFCKKSFAKKDSYREHLQIHEGPQYVCSYCPQRFVQRSNMIRHERRHTGERPYACQHCDRTFADKGACSSHVKTHTIRQPFECEYCHQTFVQKQKLTYHIRKHTGENLETCTICSKVFTSSYSLRIHMQIHERKQGDLVPCPLCKRGYSNKRSMMRHLRSAHTNARYYSCPLCSKRLTNAQGLRTHVLTHATTNMFWCKVCPKTFAVKRTILKHVKRRHRVKGDENVVRQYYTQLDPRDCGIDLDEEGIVSVFGAQRRTSEPRVTLVPLPNIPNARQPVENTGDPTSSEGETEKDANDSEEERDDMKKKVKDENSQNSEDGDNVLEPTDFVTVKIEPLNSDYEGE